MVHKHILLIGIFLPGLFGCQPSELKSDNEKAVEGFVQKAKEEIKKTKLGGPPKTGRSTIVKLQLDKSGKLIGSLLGLGAKKKFRFL